MHVAFKLNFAIILRTDENWTLHILHLEHLIFQLYSEYTENQMCYRIFHQSANVLKYDYRSENFPFCARPGSTLWLLQKKFHHPRITCVYICHSEAPSLSCQCPSTQNDRFITFQYSYRKYMACDERKSEIVVISSVSTLAFKSPVIIIQSSGCWNTWCTSTWSKF